MGRPCTNWSAWSLAGDGWKYSNVGTSGIRIRDGKVIGWNWAAGSTGQAEPPSSAGFEVLLLDYAKPHSLGGYPGVYDHSFRVTGCTSSGIKLAG